ncbi:unnamed protein product [Rhizophagus irregularis]|nr:unnamed protein product [Rhizophagus irregularis]
MTEVNKVYGMTQNPETNDYMIVLSDKFTLEFMNEVASHNKVDNANSLNRPTAITIREELWKFITETSIESQQQINENVDGNLSSISNNISSASSWYKPHSEAIYESRLLNFYNLPEPKNSDDYYEQNDDIISKKFSDSLQINFSQLNINKDDSLQMDIDN